ncbi:MAG: metal ABC transporter substrate-binding protein [Fimbriiglobus sp.]
MLSRRQFFAVGGLSAVGVVVGFSGCSQEEDKWPKTPGPKVAASFPAIASIAMNIAGEHATVRTVLSNQGPHSGDVKLSEPRMLSTADVFFINGLGLDDTISTKMLKAANKNLRYVPLGEKLDKKVLLEGCGCNHEEGHDHGHNHDHGDGFDAHVWMGLRHAITFARVIRSELKELDPAHAADYDRRCTEFEARLAALEAEGKAKFATKTNKNFLPFHASMAYFAETYGLKMIDPIQQIAGKEPSSAKLEEITKTCQKENVRVIAVEPQFSAKSSAKVILDQLKARGVADVVMVELDPLETCDIDALNAGWYEARMRANIDALAGAFK